MRDSSVRVRILKKMRRALYVLGIFLLIAIIAFWQFFSSVSGELIVNEEFEQWLIDTFGENYLWYVYGVSIVGFLIIGTSVVYGVFKDRLPGKAKDKDETRIEEELFERACAEQRKGYQKRLDQKLANRYPINLELEDTREGSPELGRLYTNTIEPGDPGNDILKIYQNANEKLLIIGEPGAGKTTVLLQLAIQLVDAQPDKIPVVIDIATWRPRFKTVEEWLIELLPQDGFNKAMAKKVVVDKLITPLFDGLDELKEEDRAGCLEAIRTYGSMNGTTFVITSRIDEYKVTSDAPVEGQIAVKPLTLAQIRYSLQGAETSGLLDAIDRDEYFREAMLTPFYLNTAQLLFSKKRTLESCNFQSNSKKGREEEIRKIFLDESLEKMEEYRPENTMRYLGFLADRMTRRRLVKFELVNIQYDWGEWGRFSRKTAFILASVINNLVDNFALGFSLSIIMAFFLSFIDEISILDIFYGNIGLLIGALVFFVAVNFMLAIFYSFILNDNSGNKLVIYAKGSINWSIKTIFLEIFDFIDQQVTWLLLLFLFFLILVFRMPEEYDFTFFALFFIWLILFFGLFLISICVALLGVVKNNYVLYLRIGSPYQGFINSLKSFHFSILQYFHLYFLLRQKGLLPKKLPLFLEACSTINLLESAGGSWRFRHRTLQDHFAKIWEEEYADQFPDGYQEPEAKTKEE